MLKTRKIMQLFSQKNDSMPGSFGKASGCINHSERSEESSRLGFQPNRAAFTLAEGGRSPQLNATKNTKAAFTLAEVLITLGIIGVVAAITIPMFMENMTERTNTERQVNIAQKITQATDKMRALDELGKFTTTESFVDELQKHLKITKKCGGSYSEPIENCWPTDKVTTADGEEFEIKNVKTSKNLDMQWEPETNAVGLVLADGANIILAYNPTSPGVNQSEPIIASKHEYTFKNGKTKTFMGYTTNTTGGMAFIMDVNGKSKPNSEKIGNTENDIRSFNGAMLAKGKVCKGREYEGKCFYKLDSEMSWSQAKAACEAEDMELPDKDTASKYMGGYNPFGTDDWVWTSSTNKSRKIIINLSKFTFANSSTQTVDPHYGVLCVGK